jgi:lysophospholipase L1-like esterase
VHATVAVAERETTPTADPRAATSAPSFQALLCPKGQYTSTVRGVTARDPDGTHLTPEGSKVVWRWLAGQLRNAGLLRTA